MSKWDWFIDVFGPQRQIHWDGETWPPPHYTSSGEVFSALHRRIERLEERLNR